MTSQNLQLVPSPPVLLVCPRSADAVLSLSTFFFLQLWAFIIQTIPFEFSLFRALHED